MTRVLTLSFGADPAAQNGEYNFANMDAGAKSVHRGEDYFEVYSTVYTSLYGQVNWASQVAHA